jgi:transposase-like protein
MNDKRRKFTPARRAKFIQFVKETGLLAKSAQSVGLSKAQLDKVRKQEPEFDDRVSQALDVYRDSLEAEIRRRGVEGYEEPIYQGGVLVGHKQRYSDRLLEMLAKRHIPAFREKVDIDATVSGGVLIVSKPPSEEDWLEENDDGKQPE